MSLFIDFHDDRLPPGSFQTPVQPPDLAPGAEPLVTLCLNQEWIPFILGALTQLTMNTTWLGSDADVEVARQQANNLILIFQQAMRGCPARNAGTGGASEDYMLRQDPDNPCLLQSSVDGINWCTFADISKCITNSQPAQGTKPTPPNGGCTQYSGECAMGHLWSLPNQVNAGDVITVTNANGLWASPLDLYLNRCPDGLLWFELACVPGTGHTESGDPAPTINHDSLIAFDGTNYYDCGPAANSMPATFTIPPGISNATLVFMANNPDGTGTGNVIFDVQYCNNAAGSWSHTFDFKTGVHGWALSLGSPFEPPTWTAGVGFVGQAGLVTGAGNWWKQVEISSPVVASFTPTQIDVYGQLVFGNAPDNATHIQTDNFNINNTRDTAVVGSPMHYGDSGPFTATTFIEILQGSDWAAATSADCTGTCIISKVVVQGTGVDPFAAF